MVTSTTANVSAPCGVALFGGNATYQRAQNEVGTSLTYRARFVPSSKSSSSSSSSGTRMVADREYNVLSIAQAAMGPNSMVNVEKASPNEFACTLLSGGGGGGGGNSNSNNNNNNINNLFRVNMLTVQRKQESVIDDTTSSTTSSNVQTFACSEVVQELIRPVNVAVAAAATAGSLGASSSSSPATAPGAPPPPTAPPILKMIETVSIYKHDPTVNPNAIDCVQRTASYLVPSQSDPMMAQLYRLSRGLPVDVRQYRVQYRKVEKEIGSSSTT
jgi:hypothetical protein